MPEQFSIRPDISNHAKIEERATAERQAAELNYKFAAGQYRRAVRHYEGLGLNLIDGNHASQAPDGGLSVTLALRVRHDAFENYRLAFEAFSKFVSHGNRLNCEQVHVHLERLRIRSTLSNVPLGLASLPTVLPSKLVRSKRMIRCVKASLMALSGI